jgi:hypothetical protein
VAGFEDQEEDSEDDDPTEDIQIHRNEVAQDANVEMNNEKGRWMRREVELEDGTRQIGFWIDGMEAKVRVELQQGVDPMP